MSKGGSIFEVRGYVLAIAAILIVVMAAPGPVTAVEPVGHVLEQRQRQVAQAMDAALGG